MVTLISNFMTTKGGPQDHSEARPTMSMKTNVGKNGFLRIFIKACTI